jgi:hypothetical protein
MFHCISAANSQHWPETQSSLRQAGKRGGIELLLSAYIKMSAVFVSKSPWIRASTRLTIMICTFS